MFSVVICSTNTTFLAGVEESIRSTIGTEFELLVWDNRIAKKGLCEVYNSMAAGARFPFICFIHEDVLFKTDGWGNLLADLFSQNPRAALIGLAGGKYKSRLYSGWFSGQVGLDCFNVTHRVLGKDEKMVQPAMVGGPAAHKVICIDGVFMCCRRDAWQQVRFDDDLLKGFHFYDIDFSLRVSRLYDVLVAMNIDLVHITKGGDYSDVWIQEAMLYHRNRHQELPLFLEGSVDPQEIGKLEVKVARQWLDWMKLPKISWRLKFKWILDQKLYRMPSLWYPILRFLVYEPWGLRRIHYRSLRRPTKMS
jgi:hypothetical protein